MEIPMAMGMPIAVDSNDEDSKDYMLKCPHCGNTDRFRSSERCYVGFLINRYGEYVESHTIEDSCEDGGEYYIYCDVCKHELTNDPNVRIPDGFGPY